MGNINDRHSQAIHDLDQNQSQRHIQCLNHLQSEMDSLKIDKNGENSDINHVFINNITNAVTQVVVEQVKQILIEFMNGNKNVNEE